MKTHKSEKRRHGNKLNKMTHEQKKKRAERNERKGRAAKIKAKQKVIPGTDDKITDND